MTLTIWKQELSLVDLQDVRAPKGAMILAFRNQRENPCIWFLCDLAAEKVVLGRLRIIGTGHMTEMAIDGPDWSYVGTDLFDGGKIVFHAFFSKEVTR